MLQVLRLSSLATIAPTLLLTLPAMAAIEAPPVPDAAKVLPPNTAYVVLLSMQDETWQQLNQYAFFQDLTIQSGEPLDAGGLPFLPTELDYQADIAPWVGDTTALALLPLERPQVTVVEEHEVLVAPIARPENFQNFLQTVAELRGAEAETQLYRAIPILYWKPQFLADEAESFPEFPALPPLEPAVPPVDEVPPELPVKNLLKALPAEDPSIMLPPAQPVPDVPGLAIAVFPDFIIAAQHPAAIRSWIDRRPTTAEASLATQEKFLRTLAHPQYDIALGVLYGNLAEMVKYSLSDLSVPDLPIDLPVPENIAPGEIAELASLQLDSSVEVLVYPTRQGLRLQGRGYYDDTLLQTLSLVSEPDNAQILNQVPINAYGLLSGRNIAGVWQGAAAALEATGETTSFLQQARDLFQAFTGLDLDRDFFGWMDQGFSVFLFPTQETPLTLFSPELELGVGIALQTSDRPTAENTLAQLDKRLQGGFIQVNKRTVNNTSVSSWAIDLDGDWQSDSFLSHGWATEDTLVITTSVESLTEILTQRPNEALPNSPYFQRAIQDFPKANQGYLYTDLGPTRSLIFRLFPTDPADLELAEFRQLIGSVQTLSGTLSFSEDYIQVDGLVMLAPARPQ